MEKQINKNFFVIILFSFVALVMLYFVVFSDKPVSQQDDSNQDQNENQISDDQLKPLRPIDETDQVWGDANAAVKIIIYDDFECPFCADFFKTTDQIKEEFGDKVAIAFRHFPLSSHPNALPAALASECAAEQGKFWEMYDKLFTDNISHQMNIDQYKRDAAQIGLDQAQFNQCLETEKYKEKVLAQMLEGKNIGVTGTPTIFVENEIYPGAYPMDDFTDKQGNKQEGMRSIINRKLVN